MRDVNQKDTSAEVILALLYSNKNLFVVILNREANF